jgi:site-specific DNA-cytosine methylase
MDMKIENIKFGSVCSGIEAASVAWEPLGWKASWFAEIEKFPAAVLAHHWPDVPNLGDMTEIRGKILIDEVEAPDVLVGGTPCQAFSVAGKRESLNDERGQLTLSYVRLLDAIDSVRHVRGDEPAVCVWENVPGCLNTKDNAFGCFLGALAGEENPLEPAGGRWTNAGCVSGPQRKVAWRVLDAQYFGVAQRRRRVFVVASARKDFDPGEVLFERQSVGIPKTSEEAREIENRCVSPTITRNYSRGVHSGGEGYIYDGIRTRRYTPNEFELLQGFPLNHTNIPYGRAKYEDQLCPDGHRYKALGNSMPVPSMRWIGERIKKQF